MSKIKVFLTGGNGFIGKNILEGLSDEFEILSPSHRELDLTDFNAVEQYLKKHPVEVVINAAALGVKRGEVGPEFFKANLRIFFNLVRAKPYYQRMIMLGSGAEYDKSKDIASVREEDFDRSVPADDYGFYKYTASKYAVGTDYIIHLRLFAIFGKHEDYATRFISNAICRVLINKPVTIKQNVVFDYLYVKDLAKIIRLCILKKPAAKIINVGSGIKRDLRSIAELVVKLTSASVPIEVKNEGYGKEYTCDNSLLTNTFPELMLTDFEQAVGELVNYYRSVLPEIDQNKLLQE